jgi:hypothetical protein
MTGHRMEVSCRVASEEPLGGLSVTLGAGQEQMGHGVHGSLSVCRGVLQKLWQPVTQ